LDEETEIELKVLAKFIESHLRIEEKDLFSLMRKYLDDDVQNEMGFQFFRLRGFTTKDLKNHSELQEELRKLVENPQNGAATSKLLRNIEMKIHHQTA
jgi:hemerythrin-like domain-containing protein